MEMFQNIQHLFFIHSMLQSCNVLNSIGSIFAAAKIARIAVDDK